MRHFRHHPTIARGKSSVRTRLLQCISHIHSSAQPFIFASLRRGKYCRIVSRFVSARTITRMRDPKHACIHALYWPSREILLPMDMGDKRGGIIAGFARFSTRINETLPVRWNAPVGPLRGQQWPGGVGAVGRRLGSIGEKAGWPMIRVRTKRRPGSRADDRAAGRRPLP
jgi:hypothetical protein